MTVSALSHPSVQRTVGGIWDLLVDVRDVDGVLVDAVPVITVTLPDSTTATPTVETVTTGVYRAEYTLATVGRHLARAVATGYGVADFAAYVSASTVGADMPDVDACRAYDPSDLGSWTDEQVQDALDAEASAQRAVCKVGAVYPPDLAEAVKRRVQCNLARRPLALAVLQGDAESGPTVPPVRDPEVRRLEGPWRKRVVG
jgi:hypothetical protein